MFNFYFLFSFEWEKFIGICNKKCILVLSLNFISLNIRCNKIFFMSKFWKKINSFLGLLLKCILCFLYFDVYKLYCIEMMWLFVLIS